MGVWVGPARIASAAEMPVGTAAGNETDVGNEFVYLQRKDSDDVSTFTRHRVRFVDAPAAPQSLAVSAKTATTLSIQWGSQSGLDAATVYKYRHRTSAEGSTAAGTWSSLTSTTSNTATITGLTKDQPYDIEVYALNVANDDGARGNPESKSSLANQVPTETLVQSLALISPYTQVPVNGNVPILASPSGFSSLPTFAWTVSGVGTLPFTTGNPATLSAGAMVGTATVTCKATSGSETATASVQIEVVAELFNILIRGPAVIGVDDVGIFETEISSNFHAATAFAWSVEGGAGGTVTPTSVGGIASYSPAKVGSATIKCVATRSGVEDTATHLVSVIISTNPVLPITGPLSVDNGGTAMYTADLDDSGATFRWAVEGGGVVQRAGRTVRFDAPSDLADGMISLSTLTCTATSGSDEISGSIIVAVVGTGTLKVDVTAIPATGLLERAASRLTATVPEVEPQFTVAITGIPDPAEVQEGGTLNLGVTVTEE